MRINVLIALLFCFTGFYTHAQKGTIKGLLKDSTHKQILPLASVTVFTAKDTAVVTYRLSDPLGEFQIPGIPLNVLCRVVITYQGFKVYRKEFQLTKESPLLNLGTIYMVDDPKALDEILITAERPPMSVRNDTLEFNANAFKTLPSAMVEDLLKKLPGVDVDLDGNITVRGRKVNRLLVDGKEFFGGDHKVATRNLPANIVDKVQVSDDKEEMDNNPLLPKEEVGQVVNIKLKKAIRQGWFGKAYAGAGTDSRHEMGAIVNLFRDTTQISFIGYSNNVNKPGFNLADIQNIGGFNRSGTGSLSIGADGGYQVNGNSFGGGGQGIQHSKGGGFNFNNQYGKKLTVNLQYFYGQVNNNNEQVSNYQRFYKDTVLTSPSFSDRSSVSKSSRAAGSIIWKIDSVTSFTFRPNFGWRNDYSNGFYNSSTTDNFKGLVNQNRNNAFGGGANYQYSHTLSFNRSSRKKKGRTFNINSTVSINNNDNDSYNEGVYTFYRLAVGNDSLVNQLRSRGNGGVRSRINLNYTEPFSKTLSLTLTHSTEYIKDYLSTDFYSMDLGSSKYSIYSESFSNGSEKNMWQHISSANFSYRKKKWWIAPALNFQWLNNQNSFTKNQDVNRYNFYVYPSLNLSWDSWRLSYSVNINEPNAYYLQRIIDISSPLYKQYGNPNLQSTYNHNINLSYFKYMQKSGSSLNFSVSATFVNNATLTQTFLDSNRVTISQPVNVNGTKNFFIYGNYNRQYKFNKNFRLSLRPSYNGSYNKSFVSINGNLSEADYIRASFSFGVLLNYKDKIELNQRYGLNMNQSFYADKKNYRNNEVVTHSTESELILRWPNHFVWESIINYTYNPQVSSGIRASTVRWSGGVNYLFLSQDRAQLKLSAYDMLNQNVNVFRYTSESSISDIQTTTLRRYCMLSLIYNIRNFSSGGKVGGKDRTFGFW